MATIHVVELRRLIDRHPERCSDGEIAAQRNLNIDFGGDVHPGVPAPGVMEPTLVNESLTFTSPSCSVTLDFDRNGELSSIELW